MQQIDGIIKTDGGMSIGMKIVIGVIAAVMLLTCCCCVSFIALMVVFGREPTLSVELDYPHRVAKGESLSLSSA